MNGQIKFCKPRESWGKISIEGQTKDVYFNLKNVEGDLKTLIDVNKFEGEQITFEIVNSSMKPGEREAINIKLDNSKRKVGHIISFDQERGIGTIQDFETKEKLFFHHSGILKPQADKYERVEVGEPVVFTIGMNDKGKCAIEISKIDNRYYIEEFAYYSNLRQSLSDLKSIAEIENWDYLKKPTKGVPVLFSFINQTCIRIVKQNKIIKGKSTKDKTEFA